MNEEMIDITRIVINTIAKISKINNINTRLSTDHCFATEFEESRI
tara:strand:- start:100 stop:234 length:135 start_codon:yes stop_codon:yes gene_type:complete